jgi:hypothetical protein
LHSPARPLHRRRQTQRPTHLRERARILPPQCLIEIHRQKETRLIDEFLESLNALGVTPIVRDERFSGQPLSAPFRGELRPEQQVAAIAMLAHDTGVLSATTAFGKMVIAASCAFSRTTSGRSWTRFSMRSCGGGAAAATGRRAVLNRVPGGVDFRVGR